MSITTHTLLESIGAVVPHTLVSTMFQSPMLPAVFVDPAIETDDEEDPFAAEVILIAAPAAVGKSTVARFVASKAGVPLLDLAQVPVAAGSLRGLVGGYIESEPPAVEALLGGRLALVIDALDEGRVRSGEDAFLQFLSTTWELLDKATFRSTPALILFGRPNTVDDVEVTLELHNENRPSAEQLRYRRAELAFFDEDGAVELVRRYAQAADSNPSRIDSHWAAISRTVRTYNRSIARALGLKESDDLWSDELGRAFAGYAPVLAALGSLIAATTDFQSLAARLDHNYEDAWAPIEEVVRLILDREVRKLHNAVAPMLVTATEMPPEAYSPQEQLAYLLDHVHGDRPLQGRIPDGLRGPDAEAYASAVNQMIPEHPFVRDRGFTNPVFAGFALAAGIREDRLRRPPSQDLLGQAARSPFLWRSFRHQRASHDELIDGIYLGYLLASRWNDPGEPSGPVLVSWKDRRIEVSLPEWGRMIVSPPIRFFERVQDLEMILGSSDEVALQLAGEAMTMSGPVVLVAPGLEVLTKKLLLEGTVWLEAQRFESPAGLSLTIAPGASVGWNNVVSEHYPWSRAETKLRKNPMVEAQPVNRLEALIASAIQHAPSQSVIVFADDLSVPQGEPRWGWTRREYSEVFRRFLRLLIEEELAEQRQLATSGTRAKTRVSFRFGWDDLAAVARGELEHPRMRRALDRAQMEWPQRLLYR